MHNWIRRVWHLVNRSRRERELVAEMNEHRAAMHDSTRFGDTYRLLEQSRAMRGDGTGSTMRCRISPSEPDR
jgi:hypothetical protein